MASSFHQWESDPLFSAAEVVQDSADRMESLYRFLLHEQSLVQDDHPDPRLLASIDYHRRDLATILETTKWQLEDFERAVTERVVSSLAMMDKYRMKEDVIARHKLFIRAIREHINQVESSLEEKSVGKIMKKSWVNLNEHDIDGLASFLSGGNPIEHVSNYGVEDSSIMRRFLDPTAASSSKDAEIIEQESRETENLKINGVVHVDHYYGSVMENNNLRRVGSHYSARLGLDALGSAQETSSSRHNEDGSWDLEANEAKPKSFFNGNSLRRQYSRMNIFGCLNNLLIAHGGRVTRSYTKRFKDGEEERNSPTYVLSQAVQGQRRFPYHVQVNRHTLQMMLAALFTLAVLGILFHHIA